MSYISAGIAETGDFLGCSALNPAYVGLMHDVVCTYGTQGLYRLWVVQLTVAIILWVVLFYALATRPLSDGAPEHANEDVVVATEMIFMQPGSEHATFSVLRAGTAEPEREGGPESHVELGRLSAGKMIVHAAPFERSSRGSSTSETFIP